MSCWGINWFITQVMVLLINTGRSYETTMTKPSNQPQADGIVHIELLRGANSGGPTYALLKRRESGERSAFILFCVKLGPLSLQTEISSHRNWTRKQALNSCTLIIELHHPPSETVHIALTSQKGHMAASAHPNWFTIGTTVWHRHWLRCPCAKRLNTHSASV